MEDLLALKDGEGSAWARRHLGECAECRTGFDGLHQRVAGLKALATLNPPRDRWPEVRANLLKERRERRMVRVRWGSLALAASLAGVLSVRAVRQHQADATQTQDLASVVTRSQQLENELSAYDPGSRVMSTAKAAAVAELEDRIAAVDDRLNQNRELPTDNRLDLWRERVNLMQGLVNVHVARATYSGM